MKPVLPRIQVSGDLFEAVQSGNIFQDCKSFVDCCPKLSPQDILTHYQTAKQNANFNLREFVETYFVIPPTITDIPEHNHQDMHHYIQLVWTALRRKPLTGKAHDSLLPLPNDYIVPGGRFREIYYWDSYFTAVGLVEDGHVDLVESMIKNFAHLIRQYGHIPNGNRVYYLSRSQPPFFAFMLDLLERQRGRKAVLPYVDALEREYDYWMKGYPQCRDGRVAADHVVHCGQEHYLNRYWDPLNEPRPESYREDKATFAQTRPEDQAQLYHNIRAACESGWDFSSRWLRDPQDLTSIRTTEIIPVDLNAYLYFVETKLAQYQLALQRSKAVDRFCLAAEKRLAALNQFCWDESRGYYFDYCWTEKQHTTSVSAAGITPLFVSAASQHQAEAASKVLRSELVKSGGLLTTTVASGHQWDSPNGWAPLQWMAVEGLRHYELNDLARDIAQRWLGLNQHIFQQTGIMLEKYNVCAASPKAADGEYQNQFGFGWTNGVASALLGLFR